jgi:hypothetical protein
MATVARSRIRARRLALLFFAALALLAAGPPAARAAQTATPTDKLQVWDLNTARMDTGGKTDYEKFIDLIMDGSRYPYYPDIVLLQEAGTKTSDLNVTSCLAFAIRLSQRSYPGNQNYNCYETTYRGGAAIVYRTNRLSVAVPGNRLTEYTRDDLGRCAPDSDPVVKDRWHAATLLLSDGGRYVSVGSLHYPTGGRACSWENTNMLTNALGGAGIAMKILGGDTNEKDAGTTAYGTWNGWNCWYLAAIDSCYVSLGWTDVVYRACLASTPTDTWNRCVRPYNWTFDASKPEPTPSNPTTRDRRDFIFVKGAGSTDVHTIPISYAYPYDGGSSLPYSDHLGIGVLLNY